MPKMKKRNIATASEFAPPKLGEDATASAMTANITAIAKSLSAYPRPYGVFCMFNVM
jgi:hypothetical protein